MSTKVTTTLVIIFAIGYQLASSADGLPIGQLAPDREVLFSRDIAPVLKKNCIACHNASNEEGGVNLESAVQMLASDVEDVLVRGEPEASRIFLLASHASEPVMPPEDNDVSASNLNPTELAILRRWIQSGAVVDETTSETSPRRWQPIPPELQTVYGSAMTDDGRLSAVSFGNQVRLFGSKSSNPIGTLELEAKSQTIPAHDDFVQDVFLSPSGRRVVTAGYRNVKLWEMAPFEPVSIPAIDHENTLKIAMNASGTHLAALSRRGELSVGEVGMDRWLWMKSFEVPDGLKNADSSEIHLIVGAAGDQAAIGWGNVIRVVRLDGIEPEMIDSPGKITSMHWRDSGRLATADEKGRVLLWQRNGDLWTNTEHSVFDQAVLGVYAGKQDSACLIAMDISGKVARWNEASSEFVEAGNLKVPAVSASASLDGSTLWGATAAGGLWRYNIAEKKYAEVAKRDPVSEARLASDEWATLVAERRVSAQDKAVKQVQANATAEKSSIEKLAKDIDTKTKLQSDKQKSVADANKTLEAANATLEQAKSIERSKNEQRMQLEATTTQLAAKIAEMEDQLAKLKQDRTDAQKQLSEIPDAKELAATAKVAGEVVTKAAKTVAAKESELADATTALRLAKETKTRGETRLESLDAELQHQQQLLERIKADQATLKTKTASSKSLRDQSHATDQALGVLAAGALILTRASHADTQRSNSWSLWSANGDWLAELPGTLPDGNLVATSDACLLLKADDGHTYAFKNSPRLWHHHKTIGTSTGDSPFADRVLSVDVDATGTMLATGGGEPSRSGELMIWSVPDGSMIRRIRKPHDDTVLCVRFSPDGKTLATGGADQMLKLWDVETGELIKTLEGHTHHVTSIAWNVDLRQLASGSADATVKIWDLDSGKATRTISGLKTEVTGLVFIGRDNRIGIAGGDSYFRVYRTDNGSRETNAKVPGGYLYTLDANRDGTQFVVGGAEGVAVLVDKSGKQLLEYSATAD